MRQVLLSLCLISILTESSLIGSTSTWPDFTRIEWPPREVIDAVDHAIPQRYLDNLFHIGIAASSSPIDHAADDDDIEWLKKEALHIAEDREAMNATTRILTDIQKAGKFFSSFDGESLMQVPFGIQDKFGDFEYLLGFDNLRLYKDHASIDVVASIYFPLIGDTLYFAATGIQYTNSGGFVTDTKLRLIQDFAVELNQGKSSLIFRGYRPEQDIGTYLSVDCDGISSMQLGVSVAFNPEMIRPMDPHQEFVQSFAQAKYMPGSGISITDLNIPPFYFKDYTDFGFSLDGMSIDLDESSTAINYISTYLEKVAAQSSHGIRSEQWTGFYCENFTLFVGNKYIHTPDGSGIKIRGQHIVMDDLGFTGQLNLEDTDLVSLDQARLGGWSISMDGVHLDILANHLQSFGFDGLIQIPVLEAKPEEAHYIPKTGESSTTHDATNLSALRYSAIVNLDSNSLELNVEKIGEEELSIPMIFADVSFSEGSYVNVKTGNDLTITAHLNGRISLRGNLAGGSNLNVPGVGFSGMAISNKAPYFSVQTFYPLLQSDPASLGMFSLTFQSLSVVDYEPEKFRHQIKRLSIHDLSLSIGNAKDGDTFTITSSLHAMFDVKSTGFKQRWSGRGIEFEKFSFKANLPGVEQVRGEMVFFYGHPTYGDAFAGRGFVRFSFLDTDVEMACMFGNTGRDGYEYSYVDAASVFNTPARDGTETASAFQVKSLLGGYYKNMTRQDLTSFALDPLPADNGLQLGGKHSENKFVPDEGGWGIRGGLIAKFGDGAIAGLRIEYESYPSDGLGTSARFYLEGLVELMPDEKESSIVASKRMAKPGEVPADDRIKEMIVEDFAGTGSLGGYIRIEIAKTPDDKLFNAAMGIHGVAAGVGIAFYGDYYKSKEYWHLLIGKPDNRLQIAYDVKWGDRVGASLALSGYFMIGNSPDIPVEQPPPYAFGEGNQAMLLDAYNLLKSDALTNIYSQQTAALSYGKAIALGASFGITAYVNLFPIVVDAGADIGFDVLMLRQAPTCNEHNVGVRGVNGWYLKGQMYAGISAKVGIAVGKPGKEKYFKIFQGGVAAVLQGAAFNPTWGIGSWVIQFQVLFIKGSAHGVFRFGEPCANIIQPQIAKDLIENIYPSRPQLAISTEEPGSVGINSDFLVDFSMPVHRSVVESVVNFQTGESNDLKLSLRCQAYITYDDGSSIASDTFVRNEGYTLLIRPKTMLRPGAEVRLHINAKIFDDQGIYNIEGEVFTVDTMVAFQVDPRGILSLTTEDIVVSYPMLGQQFFHPEEYPQMMIDFGKDISDVDVVLSSSLHHIINGQPEKIEQIVTRIVNGKTVQERFNKIHTEASYEWKVIANLPSGESGEICSIPFHTSEYLTFKDKLETLTFGPIHLSEVTQSDTMRLHPVCSEPLEFYDGNQLTLFLAETVSTPSETQSISTPKTPEIPSIKGSNYLTRFEAPFKPSRKYRHHAKIHHEYLPYGKKITLECSIDDTPEAKAQADPQDRFLEIEVFDKRDFVLDVIAGEVSYNLLSSIKADYIAYQKLQPIPPPYYSQCESLYKGPIPGYEVSRYPLSLRYYLPAFEKYSKGQKVIDFTIER